MPTSPRRDTSRRGALVAVAVGAACRVWRPAAVATLAPPCAARVVTREATIHMTIDAVAYASPAAGGAPRGVLVGRPRGTRVTVRVPLDRVTSLDVRETDSGRLSAAVFGVSAGGVLVLALTYYVVLPAFFRNALSR